MRRMDTPVICIVKGVTMWGATSVKQFDALVINALILGNYVNVLMTARCSIAFVLIGLKMLWQKPFEAVSKSIRSEVVSKHKRKTKLELVMTIKKQIERKEKESMPKYDSQVSYQIRKGETYEITSAEPIITRNNLEGLRVEMRSRDSGDNKLYAQTLWPSGQTSATSAWGSFVAILGNDTDEWPHKWISVVEWQPRNCVLRLAAAPKPKTALGKKAQELGGQITIEGSK